MNQLSNRSDNPSSQHTPRKRFGQNFLRDQNIIDKIVRAIHPSANDNLVEIGPGQGALTLPLLDKCPNLQVIELDRDLAAALRQKQATFPDLIIHEGDALKFDFSTLMDNTAKNTDTKLRIVGNLPYNISTPLLFHLLNYRELIIDMHFMLQKEVVERMASPPGNKSYGRLSVMTQYFCEVESLFPVAPDCFFPAPKVESAIVRLRPKTTIEPVAEDLNVFKQLVSCCFQQRRKTLRNNLRHWFTEAGANPDQLECLNLSELNLDSNARPDTISVSQFVALSNKLASLIHSKPS